VFQRKKREKGEPYEDAYPSRMGFLNFCKKFPRSEEIDQKLEEVENGLLKHENMLVQY
jgi:hypothetical protein